VTPPVRVLTTDDQRVVRDELVMLLGLLPCVEVVGAADSEEALTLACELPILLRALQADTATTGILYASRAMRLALRRCASRSAVKRSASAWAWSSCCASCRSLSRVTAAS